MLFGPRIRVLRKKRGMTQEELAKAAGLGTSTIRDYEHDRREPALSSAFSLADALDVKVDSLRHKEEGDPP